MPVVVSGAIGPVNRAVVLWNNLANVGNISGSASLATNPAVNAVDPDTWSSWRAPAAPSAISCNLGSPFEVDAVGIAAHTLFSSGVTQIQIQHSTNGASWTTALAYTPTSDDDLFFIFQPLTYAYWRVNISGQPANIGYVSFGKRLTFPSAPVDDYVPLNYAREYTKMRNESLKGQLLGNRVIAAGAATEVDLGYVTRAWGDTYVPGFKSHYDQGGTFFYAGCPSKYPMDMGYCWGDGDSSTVSLTYVEADKLSTLSFPVRSYVAQ